MIAAVVGIASFTQTLAQGGSLGLALRNGIISGLSAFAFGSIAQGADFSFLGMEGLPAQALAMGGVGGITSTLQGGKFGHGFISAGIDGAIGLSGSLKLGKGLTWANAGRTLARVVVGGTLSEVTGGKFANGAAYAAFSAIAQLAFTSNTRLDITAPQPRMVDTNGDGSFDTVALVNPDMNAANIGLGHQIHALLVSGSPLTEGTLNTPLSLSTARTFRYSSSAPGNLTGTLDIEILDLSNNVLASKRTGFSASRLV